MDLAWTALTGLPPFDPDLDRDPLPAPVAALRDLLAGADAVGLCTPEYAGALPGAFKRLDWTVGSTVFSDKPVDGSRSLPTPAAVKEPTPSWPGARIRPGPRAA